ncbi:MAG: hypothetical protein EXS11_07345 [Gemmataceae bacterium]|nr:hypothetical protein [Gemmataceae bacterium]
MMFTNFRMGAVALFGITLMGCGDGISYSEVTGTVKLKGVPLDKIQVEFIPTTKGHPSVAITDEKGFFSLKGQKGVNGAVVGNHKVVLRDTNLLGTTIGRKNEDVDFSKGKPKRISEKLGDLSTTPLDKEVKPGKNTIDFDL